MLLNSLKLLCLPLIVSTILVVGKSDAQGVVDLQMGKVLLEGLNAAPRERVVNIPKLGFEGVGSGKRERVVNIPKLGFEGVGNGKRERVVNIPKLGFEGVGSPKQGASPSISTLGEKGSAVHIPGTVFEGAGVTGGKQSGAHTGGFLAGSARSLSCADRAPKDLQSGTSGLGGGAAKVAGENGVICGRKWGDINGNGAFDPGEPELKGWQIILTATNDPQGRMQQAVTDANGEYWFTGLKNGQYVVAEVMQPGWKKTFPSTPGHLITLAGKPFESAWFGNASTINKRMMTPPPNTGTDKSTPPTRQSQATVYVPDKSMLCASRAPKGLQGTVIGGVTGKTTGESGIICGRKWGDINGNGVPDSGEPGLKGWQIVLKAVGDPGGAVKMAVTDANGEYWFTGLKNGRYVVAEVMQADWKKTYPAAPGHLVTLAGSPVEDAWFGNIHALSRPMQTSPNSTGGKAPASKTGVFGNNGTTGLTTVLPANSGGVTFDIGTGGRLQGKLPELSSVGRATQAQLGELMSGVPLPSGRMQLSGSQAFCSPEPIGNTGDHAVVNLFEITPQSGGMRQYFMVADTLPGCLGSGFGDWPTFVRMISQVKQSGAALHQPQRNAANGNLLDFLDGLAPTGQVPTGQLAPHADGTAGLNTVVPGKAVAEAQKTLVTVPLRGFGQPSKQPATGAQSQTPASGAKAGDAANVATGQERTVVVALRGFGKENAGNTGGDKAATGGTPLPGGSSGGTAVIGNLGAGGSVVRMDPLVLKGAKGAAPAGELAAGRQPQFGGGIEGGDRLPGNISAGGTVVRMDPLVLKDKKGAAPLGEIAGGQALFGDGSEGGDRVLGNLGVGGSVVRMDPLVLKGDRGAAPGGKVTAGGQPLFGGGVAGGDRVLGKLGAGGAVVRMDPLVLKGAKGAVPAGEITAGGQPLFGGDLPGGSSLLGNIGAGGAVVRMDPLVLKGARGVAPLGEITAGSQPLFGGFEGGDRVLGNLGVGGSVVRMDPLVLKGNRGTAPTGEITAGGQPQFGGGFAGGDRVLGNIGAGGAVVRMDPLVLKGAKGTAPTGEITAGGQPLFGGGFEGGDRLLGHIGAGGAVVRMGPLVLKGAKGAAPLGEITAGGQPGMGLLDCPDCGIELVQVIPHFGNNPMNVTNPIAGGSTNLVATEAVNLNLQWDTQPPTVSVPAPLIVAAQNATGAPVNDPAVAAFLSGATATDNVGVVGPITNNAPAGFFPVLPNLPAGRVTTVIFVARDASGNQGTATSTVTVKDQTAPVISNVPVPATVIIPVLAFGASAPAGFLTSPTATDNVDGGVPVTHDPIWDAPNAFPVGTTNVPFTAVDSAGNVGTANSAVTVQRIQTCNTPVTPLPVLTHSLNFSYLTNSGQCELAQNQSLLFAAGANIFKLTEPNGAVIFPPSALLMGGDVGAGSWSLVSASAGTVTPGAFGSVTNIPVGVPVTITLQCLNGCLATHPGNYTGQVIINGGVAPTASVSAFE